MNANTDLGTWFTDPQWNEDLTREDIINSGWVRGTGPIVNVHNVEAYEKVLIDGAFAIVNYAYKNAEWTVL